MRKVVCVLALLVAGVPTFAAIGPGTAMSTIQSYFSQTNQNQGVKDSFLYLATHSRANLEVIVELSHYAAFEGSSTLVYLTLAMCASQAKIASAEFLVLAEEEKRVGEESLPREIVAMRLVAASSKAECAQIMKDRDKR